MSTTSQVGQALAEPCGFPWYKDDQKNFPGATEADGVCTGEHVPETLAVEAASRIRALEEENARLRQSLGDDLSTCSAPGCGAWYCADNTDWHHAERTQDAAAGWIWSTPPEAEYPLAWCPAHAGMAVSG